jgi:hypothetical protein
VHSQVLVEICFLGEALVAPLLVAFEGPFTGMNS